MIITRGARLEQAAAGKGKSAEAVKGCSSFHGWAAEEHPADCHITHVERYRENFFRNNRFILKFS